MCVFTYIDVQFVCESNYERIETFMHVCSEQSNNAFASVLYVFSYYEHIYKVESDILFLCTFNDSCETDRSLLNPADFWNATIS